MKIKLAGALERFGGPYEIKRRSAWECWRLLSVQIPGLAREVFSHPEIAIIADGECLSRDLLTLEFDADELTFLPVPRGADFGLSALIGLGATAGTAGVGASVGAGAITAASVAAAAGATTGIGGFLGAVGTALAGVSAGTWLTIATTALSVGLSLAQSAAAHPPKRDANGNSAAQSYSFNGAVNTTQEGVSVQLILGRVRTGGIIISYTQYSTIRRI
jgi:predicted phage tail protein